ncbi:hypothetical protein EO087_14945 [Dyella sp. M7H15-1]|uniref:DUF3472 domain-containing protein n=1 Tax=Dyella sp. M7H15-1 TaxID=2501295 RepID=UPI001004EB1E|nr:hypothetical protein [Dyella sp. M7H15-1]QAU25124.1 hypothetical protein EO087_14945 [Dyella sp. M7H15-1]
MPNAQSLAWAKSGSSTLPASGKNNPHCSSAAIQTESGNLLAMPNSLFSNTQYQQGNSAWTPKLIRFRLIASGSPVEGCLVKIHPAAGNDGHFYYEHGQPPVSDSNGYVSGWWIAGTNPLPKLVAEIPGSSQKVELNGIVSDINFRNLAPAPYLLYGLDGNKTWTRFLVSVTPIASAPMTFFQVANWNGGYFGLQQTGPSTNPENKKIIFTIWNRGTGVAHLIEGPSEYCKEHMDSAEGSFMQCFQDYNWDTEKTYAFEIEARHTIPDNIDFALTINGATYAVIRVPAPSDYYPTTPAAFLEQYADDQYSCAASEERSAIFSSIYKMAPGGEHIEAVEEGYFSRPYDPGYGHGSLCFNYDYGDTDLLAVPKEQRIHGFFLSTGGNRFIGEPADGAVSRLNAHLSLNNPYEYITTQQEMDRIAADPNYLDEKFLRGYRVSVRTSDGNWTREIILPAHSREKAKFNLIVQSQYPVQLTYGNKSHEIARGTTVNLVFNNGRWTEQ